MMEFEKPFQTLQDAISVKNKEGKNCADRIDETLWRENVMEALNRISLESADELQKETGKPYPKDSQVMRAVKSAEDLQKFTGESFDSVIKDSNGNIVVGRKNLKYSEAPPTRILSMTLNLCYWLGFLDASNNHELHKGAIAAWERIEKAYQSGKALHHNAKLNQSNGKH